MISFVYYVLTSYNSCFLFFSRYAVERGTLLDDCGSIKFLRDSPCLFDMVFSIKQTQQISKIQYYCLLCVQMQLITVKAPSLPPLSCKNKVCVRACAFMCLSTIHAWLFSYCKLQISNTNKNLIDNFLLIINVYY